MLVVQIERFNCASFITLKNYKCTDYNGCYEQQMYFEITSLNFFFFFRLQDFELDVLEEAYTTEHWLVRIYKVKDLDNRGTA